MAQKTFYILQEFAFERKKWRPKQAREVPSRDTARRAVERLQSLNKPAVAFSRTGDPETGDFADAEIIASFNVPPEFMGEHADL